MVGCVCVGGGFFYTPTVIFSRKTYLSGQLFLNTTIFFCVLSGQL